MSGRTRERNQARLVRCSAGCGAMVWLAGALPTTADGGALCRSCTAAKESGAAQHPDRPGEASAAVDAPRAAPRDGVERPF